MLPKVELEGGVVTAPELRFTPSGKSVTNFRVACKDRVRDGSGGWTDGETTYLGVTVWGKPGENLVESVVVGDQVVITGRLKQREYEKDGVTRVVHEVTAESIGVSLLFNDAKTPKMRGEAPTPRAAPPAAEGLADQGWTNGDPADIPNF